MITPKSIANVKLRIASPPRMKMQRSTNSVEADVMIVRLRVVLMERFKVVKKSCLG